MDSLDGRQLWCVWFRRWSAHSLQLLISINCVIQAMVCTQVQSPLAYQYQLRVTLVAWFVEKSGVGSTLPKCLNRKVRAFALCRWHGWGQVVYCMPLYVRYSSTSTAYMRLWVTVLDVGTMRTLGEQWKCETSRRRFLNVFRMIQGGYSGSMSIS